MGKRWLCGLLCLVLAGGMTGCAPMPAAKQTDTYMDVFDTVCTVTAYGVPVAVFREQSDALHGQLKRHHQLFDMYNTYEGMNNLKTVNDSAGGDPVAVDTLILDLLEFGQRMYALTEGRVNMLFGPVLSLWHDARRQADSKATAADLPARSSLEQAAAHTSPQLLIIDRQAGTVQLTHPDARLDVGALAKGYAAQLAAEYAAETLGWQAALLDIGGNLCVVGDKGGQPFTVGIRNPDTDSARPYLMKVGVSNRAVVTSGDYQRYFMVDGVRYHHIIDVDTLYPATGMRSVTILYEDSGVADALSTALFTLPLEKGRALLAKVPGAEALWVLSDGQVQYSDGFEAAILS